VVFDLNGVLWWDGHLHEQAWQRMAQRLRGARLSPEEMADHVHGRHNDHTLVFLLGRPLDDAEAGRLGEEKEVIYRQLCLADAAAFRLSPGAARLLDWLAARGVPRTIATAAGKANLDFFIAHLHLDRWFDVATIVYDDGTRPGKPAPDSYLEAVRRLKVEPACCIVIEDSRSGIAAARAAGIGRIVALGPADRHAALACLPGVSLVVKSLVDFPRHWLARDGKAGADLDAAPPAGP
jgi:HAD superfamily hydrolase (TIGR01509 family)